MVPESISRRIIGLTGGVASGKSTVARLFAEQGIPVLDADQIARRLRAPGGAAHPLLLQRFGTDDPKKLREIIFRDSQAKTELEKLLHPLIIQASEEAAREEFRKNPKLPFVIYEAALLIETGRYKNLGGLIVVHATVEQRRTRLVARDGILTELADQMILSQTSDEHRRQAAAYLIQNDGTLESLKTQVAELIQRISQSLPA